MSNLEANKALTLQFLDAVNRQDIDTLEKIFHKDFVWNTALIGDDDPNELPPLQSKLLKGTNLPHYKPRLTREEALTVWRSLFKGAYDEAHQTASGKQATKAPKADAVKDENRIHMYAHSLTAEEDRVAMEAESDMVHPQTGRRYNNHYHFLFKVKDGQLTLFKEYQDTLHIYDFLAE
jgi:ketosteroid isomerase-like protein